MKGSIYSYPRKRKARGLTIKVSLNWVKGEWTTTTKMDLQRVLKGIFGGENIRRRSGVARTNFAFCIHTYRSQVLFKGIKLRVPSTLIYKITSKSASYNIISIPWLRDTVLSFYDLRNFSLCSQRDKRISYDNPIRDTLKKFYSL